MHNPLRSRLLAGIGVMAGVILMFVGIFYHLEEGPHLRTWDELRFGKRVFFAGAGTALAVPALAFLVSRRERTAKGSQKRRQRDDLE
jgi:hypothetical protein